MKINLTPLRIQNLKTKKSEQIFWDTQIPKFGVLVKKNGTKRYIHMQMEGGKLKKRTLGDPQVMGLDEARNLAMSLNMSPPENSAQEDIVPCPRFDEFVRDVWLPERTQHYKPKTKRAQYYVLRAHLLSNFGTMRMDAIDKNTILNWFDRYSKKYPSGANGALEMLSAILNHAVRRQVIDRNPARHIAKNPKVKRNRFLSDEERARLLDALDKLPQNQQRNGDILRLMLFTGCRKGEILNLRWDEVHGCTLKLQDSKTGARTVWLSDDAKAVIARQRLSARSSAAYVFPSPRNAEKPISNITFFWFDLRRKIDLKGVRMHDLRHSFASQAVRQGVALPVISKLLGHSSVTMTMRYTHVSDTDVEAAAERIAERIDAMLGA